MYCLNQLKDNHLVQTTYQTELGQLLDLTSQPADSVRLDLFQLSTYSISYLFFCKYYYCYLFA